MTRTAGHVNSRLKGWPGWIVLLFVAVALVAIGASADRGARTPAERADALERRIACPVCDGESVFESRNQSSINMRNQITQLVNEGELSDDEIIARIEDRWGEGLLLVPKSTGVDTLVWALPVAALICGVAGLAVAFRRWKIASASDSAPTDDERALVAAALGDPSRAVDDEYDH